MARGQTSQPPISAHMRQLGSGFESLSGGYHSERMLPSLSLNQAPLRPSGKVNTPSTVFSRSMNSSARRCLR